VIVRPLHPHCILIVERDAMLCNALVKLIESLGHQTETAHSLDGALRNIHRCDRVLIDLNLADGVGIPLLQRIREKALPVDVAVLTDGREYDLMRVANRLGTQTIFTMPPDSQRLQAWLENSGH
jgi:DNA-binding NtrC family response regulator